MVRIAQAGRQILTCVSSQELVFRNKFPDPSLSQKVHSNEPEEGCAKVSVGPDSSRGAKKNIPMAVN